MLAPATIMSNCVDNYSASILEKYCDQGLSLYLPTLLAGTYNTASAPISSLSNASPSSCGGVTAWQTIFLMGHPKNASSHIRVSDAGIVTLVNVTQNSKTPSFSTDISPFIVTFLSSRQLSKAPCSISFTDFGMTRSTMPVLSNAYCSILETELPNTTCFRLLQSSKAL